MVEMCDGHHPYLVYSTDGHNSGVSHGKQLNPEEEEEVVAVAAADGVTHPGAEVVEELDAAV